MDLRKLSAEAIGTFWLTLGGCGSAVIAAGFPQVGIGLLGVSLAFGLTVVTMAYAIGHVSGCHLNPAVTVGLAAGGRFRPDRSLPYVVAQVVGAIVGAAVLYLIASGAPGFDLAKGFASNGYARAFARQVRPRRLPGDRSGHDHDVPVHHHGRDARQGARRLCAACDRPRADADPSRQHSGDQHLGQSGAQHRARRCSSADGRSSSSGCSGSRRCRRRARRHRSIAGSARSRPAHVTGNARRKTAADHPIRRSPFAY